MSAQRKSALRKGSPNECTSNGCPSNGNAQPDGSPPNGTPNTNAKEVEGGGAQLERTLSLLDGTCFVVSCVIGAGIFISPTNVLRQVGSVGLAIGVWLLGGALSWLGALCYAEMGTFMPRSGGDYHYIREAYGDLLAFLRFYAEVTIARPTAVAVGSITFAKYLLYPVFIGCDMPEGLQVLVALLIISFYITLLEALATFLNAYDVRIAASAVNICTYVKTAALLAICCTGLFRFTQKGGLDSFASPFHGSVWEPGAISMALLSANYAYNGWDRLNLVMEELKNPSRNLPLAISFGLTIVTFVYVMANVAYFTTLSVPEFLSTPATALVFAVRLYGPVWWLVPIAVAFSVFGLLLANIFSTSRSIFVAARHGHSPQLLNMVQMHRKTPLTSVIVVGAFSFFTVLVTRNVYALQAYMQVVLSIMLILSISTLLYFRWSAPTAARPVRVSLAIPIVYLVFSVPVQVILPIVTAPGEAGVSDSYKGIECGFGIILQRIGFLMLIVGAIIYYVFVKHNRKLRVIKRIVGWITHASQKLFCCVVECGAGKEDDESIGSSKTPYNREKY